MTTTTTTPTAAGMAEQLAQGMWTYERWPENYASPITLVGTVDPYDNDDYSHDDEDAPVLLMVLTAPSGAHYWSHGVPTAYYVRPTSLRPAYVEEIADIADSTQHEVWRAEQDVAELRAKLATYEAAYELAWKRDAAGPDSYEPAGDSALRD